METRNVIKILMQERISYEGRTVMSLLNSGDENEIEITLSGSNNIRRRIRTRKRWMPWRDYDNCRYCLLRVIFYSSPYQLIYHSWNWCNAHGLLWSLAKLIVTIVERRSTDPFSNLRWPIAPLSDARFLTYVTKWPYDYLVQVVLTRSAKLKVKARATADQGEMYGISTGLCPVYNGVLKMEIGIV